MSAGWRLWLACKWRHCGTATTPAYTLLSSCHLHTQLSSNTEEQDLWHFTIQFEMNASHTGHKALRRLPQSTCRFRCHNKEEAEERSGKCIDLKKKKTSMKRCRGERVKEKKNKQRNRQWDAASCRGLLKNESKAHWFSQWKTHEVPLTALLLRTCQLTPPPNTHTHTHTHQHPHTQGPRICIWTQRNTHRHTEAQEHMLSNCCVWKTQLPLIWITIWIIS